ncbi:MAG TPA: replicative DNA helicase [Candidatus Bathyarchaeia archaeon]|nr:replicative DNA helicase [Candidatus Bathyarchaeia archaeon]
MNNLPPQSVESEESILASCFVDKDSLNEAVDFLVPEDFYRTAHRFIFAAMVDLVSAKQPVDLVTVVTKLKESGKIEEVGGAGYLSRLTDEIPPAVNIQSYCEIVKGESVKRSLIEQSNAIIKDCYSGKPASSILDKSQQRIIEIQFEPNLKTTHYFQDLIIPRIEHYEELSRNSGNITGISTGITELDNLTCGLQPTDLIYLAARPGMGKTGFALGLALKAARAGYPGIFFSLEMSKEQLTDRAIAASAKVNSQNIRFGKLSGDDWIKLNDASGKIYNLPIGIDDTGGLSLSEIRRRARKAKKQSNIQWVIIDYLQLIFTEKGHSRDREVGIVSAGLKSLAKELRVPFIVLSQLNRGLESRDNKRPRLSDLRESGNLEQDADLVLFLYRPSVYGAEEEFEGQSEIIVAKQRNGPAGKIVKIIWLENFTCFENYAYQY